MMLRMHGEEVDKPKIHSRQLVLRAVSRHKVKRGCISKVGTKLDEAKTLIKEGFDYITEMLLVKCFISF